MVCGEQERQQVITLDSEIPGRGAFNICDVIFLSRIPILLVCFFCITWKIFIFNVDLHVEKVMGNEPSDDDTDVVNTMGTLCVVYHSCLFLPFLSCRYHKLCPFSHQPMKAMLPSPWPIPSPPVVQDVRVERS